MTLNTTSDIGFALLFQQSRERLVLTMKAFCEKEGILFESDKLESSRFIRSGSLIVKGGEDPATPAFGISFFSRLLD